MAFDETLAQRIRVALADEAKIIEKKMFGGIAFMVRGHMTVGIVKNELLVRVGPDTHDKALAKPHAKVMNFTGKPMTGFIYVEAPGIATQAQLKAWIKMALDYTKSMPEKTAKKTGKKAASSKSKRRINNE